MTCAIEDYALIGDCETAALVGRNGSIDWLCWPRFDSGACFAALIGTSDNGRWLMTALDPKARISRRYRDHTLILETSIETADGAATIVDFMPPRGKASDVVRLVCGMRGQLVMRTELVIRFDYGSLIPWVTRLDDGSLRAIAGPDMVVLRTPASLHGVDFKTVGEFTISAGQTIPFVLTYGRSHLPPPPRIDPARALAETEAFWRDWASRARPAGEWSEPVIRSLITLKALTYRPSGAIVAAPTTSLPEQLGGERNWDYRYCWLRDATFTLVSLMNAGYYEDAGLGASGSFARWLAIRKQTQIMYGMTGERRLREWEVPWLSALPGAPNQFASAMPLTNNCRSTSTARSWTHCITGGPANWPPTRQAGNCSLELLKHLEIIWEEPDHGIWEVRGNSQQFTNSKVMAWVAFDRAVKTVEQFGMAGPVERWRALRDTIHEEVCCSGFNSELGAFVQSYGSKQLDASALLIPLVGFLPAEDARVRSTVEAVVQQLLIDGLVRRYDTKAGVDGLPPGEGIFLPCSFWLADNLILLGRRDEARRLFQRLLSLRNDVGLLSEEYDGHANRLLGNFPQAFSHVALINTAYLLTSQTKYKRHESGHLAPDSSIIQG